MMIIDIKDCNAAGTELLKKIPRCYRSVVKEAVTSAERFLCMMTGWSSVDIEQLVSVHSV